MRLKEYWKVVRSVSKSYFLPLKCIEKSMFPLLLVRLQLSFDEMVIGRLEVAKTVKKCWKK